MTHNFQMMFIILDIKIYGCLSIFREQVTNTHTPLYDESSGSNKAAGRTLDIPIKNISTKRLKRGVNILVIEA